MVTRLKRYVFPRILNCLTKSVAPISIMPKRSLQNQPKKKLKPNQSTNKSTKNSNFSTEHNLNTDNMVMDRVEAENQENVAPVTRQAKERITYLEPPVKSENDKKQYKVIQLENGLTALLIADIHSPSSDIYENNIEVKTLSDQEREAAEEAEEDETDSEESGEDSGSDGSDSESDACSKKLNREEKMAACGLCVGVGSFSDPPEIPGLAHFLEHMVFMGSEKYTEENDFDAFIKKRGGSDNASTECELTTFFFEVQEKHLLPALDRFAQFFIKPLMKREAITREREAVESEFQMALPSDFCRKQQLFCSFARANHPATKFGWGNLVTLKDNVTDEKLYEELHKFRERHYSAHRMKLAIQARLPLDVLEDYVTQCFENVPNNNLPPDDFTPFKGANSFDTPSFRRMYKMKPVKDICRVELTWSMPSMLELYKSKPHQYVSWILGYEGKGSLISYLRKRMWCLGISTGNEESGFEHNSMYALFSISIMLTERGREHLREVLDATFSFINLMRREGPKGRIFNEIHQIKEASFRFAAEVPPAEYVEDLCENMHYYPPRDYITGSDLFYVYHPEAIRACIDYLTPDTVNIIIADKKFNEDQFDKVEPWFKTRYTDTEIPRDWIEQWKSIEPLQEFHLPPPNPFITDTFTLIPLPDDVSKYPWKIYTDPITELWYRPDTKFKLHECYMYFHLISPMAICSLRSAVLLDLYTSILKQLLMEVLYPATVADLNHEIGSNDRGMVFKVDGSSQKLPLLLVTIANCIAKSSTMISKEFFEVIKQEQIKAYYNTFVKAKKLVRDVRLSILKLTHWTAIDKHTAIQTADYEEFQNLVRTFTDHIYIQALIQGNITEEDAIKHTQECVKTLKCGPLLPNTEPRVRMIQMPIGTQYCKVRNLNATDVNSVVVNYYECGITSIRSLVIIELLIMMMEEPLFNQLRTQEQLGYDVFCERRDTFGILDYSVTVHTQADKHSTEHVDDRIEAFLNTFNELLRNTSEKDLDSVKEALIKLKQCADIYLKEEVERNWSEIVSGDYIFDRIEKELSLIEDITVEELRDWMQSHSLNGSKLKKLSVHVVGTDQTDHRSKENDDENMEVHENGNSDTKGSGKISYSLKYISGEEESDGSVIRITDIQKYKNGLYCYPASLTKL